MSLYKRKEKRETVSEYGTHLPANNVRANVTMMAHTGWRTGGMDPLQLGACVFVQHHT